MIFLYLVLSSTLLVTLVLLWLLVHRLLQFLPLTLLALVVHVTEVPRDLEIDIRVTPVLLVAPEGVALGIVLPLTGVEDITPVDSDSNRLIEEILAETKVERSVRLTIALGDDTTGAVVTRQLQGDIIRQDEGCK